MDLVFRGVLPAGFGPDLPDESLGLLRQGLCTLGLLVLLWDTSGSFIDADNLYPAPGVQTHHHPQVFFPFKVSHYR